jgi:hypothetical protein
MCGYFLSNEWKYVIIISILMNNNINNQSVSIINVEMIVIM